MVTENKDPRVFVTQSGRVLTLRPIRSLLMEAAMQAVEEQARQDGLLVDPPTYQATDVGGQVWSFYLTEESLNVPNEPERTALNHAKWAKYQADQDAIAQRRSEKRVSLLLRYGVVTKAPAHGDESSDWEELVAALGQAVPEDDELTRRELWLKYYELSDLEVQLLIARFNLLSAGIQADKIADAEAAFRNQMENQQRKAISALQGDDGGGVGGGAAVPGGGSDATLGEDSQ